MGKHSSPPLSPLSCVSPNRARQPPPESSENRVDCDNSSVNEHSSALYATKKRVEENNSFIQQETHVDKYSDELEDGENMAPNNYSAGSSTVLSGQKSVGDPRIDDAAENMSLVSKNKGEDFYDVYVFEKEKRKGNENKKPLPATCKPQRIDYVSTNDSELMLRLPNERPPVSPRTKKNRDIARNQRKGRESPTVGSSSSFFSELTDDDYLVSSNERMFEAPEGKQKDEIIREKLLQSPASSSSKKKRSNKTKEDHKYAKLLRERNEEIASLKKHMHSQKEAFKAYQTEIEALVYTMDNTLCLQGGILGSLRSDIDQLRGHIKRKGERRTQSTKDDVGKELSDMDCVQSDRDLSEEQNMKRKPVRREDVISNMQKIALNSFSDISDCSINTEDFKMLEQIRNFDKERNQSLKTAKDYRTNTPMELSLVDSNLETTTLSLAQLLEMMQRKNEENKQLRTDLTDARVILNSIVQNSRNTVSKVSGWELKMLDEKLKRGQDPMQCSEV